VLIRPCRVDVGGNSRIQINLVFFVNCSQGCGNILFPLGYCETGLSMSRTAQQMSDSALSGCFLRTCATHSAYAALATIRCSTKRTLGNREPRSNSGNAYRIGARARSSIRCYSALAFLSFMQWDTKSTVELLALRPRQELCEVFVQPTGDEILWRRFGKVIVSY
jgi:hypothetical protein